MSIQNKDFVHPFSYFIVNAGVVQTHNLVTQRGVNDREVAKNLVWFLAWFEKEAKESLKTQIAELKETVVLTPDQEKQWQLISSIANTLHESGYFAGAHMKQMLSGGEGKEIQQVKY